MTIYWWLKTTEIYSHSSESQKSEIRVLAGPVPSKGSGTLPLPASGRSWYSRACGDIVMIPPPCLPGSPLCLDVSFSVSHKDTLIAFGVHTNPM